MAIASTWQLNFHLPSACHHHCQYRDILDPSPPTTLSRPKSRHHIRRPAAEASPIYQLCLAVQYL